MEGIKAPNWFSNFFVPRTNFHALLKAHAEKVLEGIEALEKWLKEGSLERCETVRTCEKEADQIAIEIEKKLVETFITPIDREDIYDLSDRLDDVIDSAKAAVREIEALELQGENRFVNEIASTLVEGTRCLVLAVESLDRNLPLATEQATLAKRSENRTTKIYRQAIRELFSLDDMKRIQKTKEVYNSLLDVGKQIEAAAVKLLHVIVKLR